jgi:hypothetical protein
MDRLCPRRSAPSACEPPRVVRTDGSIFARFAGLSVERIGRRALHEGIDLENGRSALPFREKGAFMPTVTAETTRPDSVSADPKTTPQPHSKKPRALVAISVFLIVLPIFNYLSVSLFFGVPLNAFERISHAFGPLGMGVVVASPLFGVLVLFTRRIGWYSMIAYGIAVIAHNLMTVVQSQSSFAYAALANSLLGLGVVIYFMRSDIRLAYLAAQERGFRSSTRVQISRPIEVDGAERHTTNISGGGARVLWADCPRRVGEQVVVAFTVGDQRFSFKATIVRVEPQTIGVSFNHTIAERRAVIASLRAVRRASAGT